MTSLHWLNWALHSFDLTLMLYELGDRGIAVLHRAYVVCVNENSAGIHISTNIPVYFRVAPKVTRL